MMTIRSLSLIAALLVTACSGADLGDGGGGSGGGQPATTTSSAGGEDAQGGAGGSATPGTIGAELPEIKRVQVSVNINDGFEGVATDEDWDLDVASGAMHHVAADGTVTDAQASASQVEEIRTRVGSTPFETQDNCLENGIDGEPYPPVVTVWSGSKIGIFGVTSGGCSDHSHAGDVIDCTSFGKILEAFIAVIPTEELVSCMPYW